MINFKTAANTRVKQYLHRNNTVQDKKAIKGFFEDLKNKGLYAARRTALIRGSKDLVFLIDTLSQEYINSHKF
jgi:hypothetical protein